MNSIVKSVYIHIPFCHNICSYCDFCKIFYNEKIVNDYLDSLNREIIANYNGEVIDTIYIGGGTPSSLNINQLNKLFEIIKIFKLSKTYEFTFECNVDDINDEMAKILYDNGVNRISVGVQTFNRNLLSVLNRYHDKKEIIKNINLLKKYFNNINVDFIYAIPGEKFSDVKNDIDSFLKLDINHISTYSFILEPNTILGINNKETINEEMDAKMYNYICSMLSNNGFKHYEISNFAKDGYESKHNLTYWNNLEYYGFGLGASGYINDIRYTNTKSLKHYINNSNLHIEEHLLSKKEKMENEMILGLRKISGVNKKDFYYKYGINIYDVFNIDYLISKKLLFDNGENIYIPSEYLYVQNSILINFLEVK